MGDTLNNGEQTSMEDPKAPMASRKRTAQTPAEELRQVLARLETSVAAIGHKHGGAGVEILDLFDQADTLIKQIVSSGGDLAPELTRFETLTQQLDKKKGAFLEGIGGAGLLQELRDAARPEEDRWWWYVDVNLDQENRLRRARVLRRSAIIALGLIVFASLYLLFLAPDEATRERYRHEQGAELALTRGDLASALIETDLALVYAPDDDELIILKGVVLDLQGDHEQAQDLYDRVRAQLGEGEAFLISRAQIYMVANRADLALVDAQRTLELDANSALGYLVMGNANTVLGNYFEAATNYERASELAGISGDVELQGMARVQLANVSLRMQSPDVSPEIESSE
jgi:tetratricopeptide (TPR) repeat protein